MTIQKNTKMGADVRDRNLHHVIGLISQFEGIGMQRINLNKFATRIRDDALYVLRKVALESDFLARFNWECEELHEQFDLLTLTADVTGLLSPEEHRAFEYFANPIAFDSDGHVELTRRPTGFRLIIWHHGDADMLLYWLGALRIRANVANLNLAINAAKRNAITLKAAREKLQGVGASREQWI